MIENVPKAPLEGPILCGSSFGLGVQRHRRFETNWPLLVTPCSHEAQPRRYQVYDHGRHYTSRVVPVYGTGGGKARDDWAEAMGIDWMTDPRTRRSYSPGVHGTDRPPTHDPLEGGGGVRLGPVLFIAVSVAFVVFLFMVVGAAKSDRGLSERPSSLPGQSARGDARSENAAQGLPRAPNPHAHPERVPHLQGEGLAEGPAGGMASSYGPGLWGNRMACGGRLWPSTHAVAHRTLRCGTPLRVCWRNRCQRLLVRDRGPFVFGRSLDLTEAAVRRFGFASARSFGVQYVEWRVL